MKLTRDDILKLARLSRLKLSEEEILRYQKELSTILDYVAQLDSVDVSGISPTYQITGLTSENSNATRADVVTEQIDQKELFKNLPRLENDHIQVERMVG
jgi:aspartyl-tRNA(Asn)/glutamyl-tRNA(Gln) amidotransferase subunit C